MSIDENNNLLEFNLINGHSYNELSILDQKNNEHRKLKFEQNKLIIDLSSFNFMKNTESLYKGHYAMLNNNEILSATDSLKEVKKSKIKKFRLDILQNFNPTQKKLYSEKILNSNLNKKRIFNTAISKSQAILSNTQSINDELDFRNTIIILTSNMGTRHLQSTSFGFISDIHLDSNSPKKTQMFFDFLDQAKNKYSKLFILGDLFEYWIGDDDQSQDSLEVIKQLKKLSDSIEVFFIAGNRDFLIAKEFENKSGIKILEDMYVFSSGNKNIMVSHGDSFCIDDKQYQSLKNEIRSSEWINDFLSKPLEERVQIANEMRAQSAEKSSNKPENIMDVNQEYISEIVKKNNIDILIHGHTHRPFIHHIDSNSIRAVLGSWEDKGWVIEYEQELTLRSFPI